MVDEMTLRNSIHSDSFRFEVTPSLWKSLYGFLTTEGKARNVITVKKDGILRGYAIFSVFVRGNLTSLSVLDMNANGKETLAKLIDGLIQRGRAEGVDLLYFRKTPSPEDSVFDEEGFLSLVESKIMAVLFNPKELLNAFSQANISGKNLRLNINGFEPITVKVSKKGIQVVSAEKPDLEVSTDSETFLKLFLGQTSLFKQLLKRKVKLSNMLKLVTVHQFFSEIKQEKWYIPFGEWV